MIDDPSRVASPDDDLLHRTANGEAEAFGQLFRRHRQAVYRFALHMTAQPATAEDIVQDVFLVVMRDAGRYEPGRSGVAAWLRGIARNCARQRLDRDRPFQPLPDEAAGNAGAAIQPDPLGDLARAEGIARLRAAILGLPVHYREVIVLCDLQELSYQEAADVVGCAIGTVRSRLFRGRDLLAAKLARRQAGEVPAKLSDTRCPA